MVPPGAEVNIHDYFNIESRNSPVPWQPLPAGTEVWRHPAGNVFPQYIRLKIDKGAG